MNRRSIFSLFSVLPFVPSLTAASVGRKTVADTAVQVNLSASQWHLFTSKPGVENAAKELNKALNAALQFCRSAESAYGRMKPVLEKYADYGAQDTEPRDFTLQPILRVAYRSNYNLLFERDHSHYPRTQ